MPSAACAACLAALRCLPVCLPRLPRHQQLLTYTAHPSRHRLLCCAGARPHRAGEQALAAGGADCDHGGGLAEGWAPCWHAALCSAACSFCATYVDEADLPQVPGRATNSLPLLRVSAEAFWIPCAAAQELFPKDKAAPRHGHHVLVAYTMLRWGQRLSLWDVSAWLWCIHCCSEAGCALLQVASAVKTGGVQLL